MREDLDKALCAKYPKIFVNRHGSMRTTCMCWGFPGDGWYNILDELCGKIQAICDRYPDSEHHQVVASQVKEKFGTLRFYIEGCHNDIFDEVHALIDEAEAKTAETCEECGEPGKARGGGWILTLCDKHDAERNKPIKVALP